MLHIRFTHFILICTSDGHVAIVHDIDPLREDTTPYHIDSKHSLNWFKVYWDGDYPGSSDENSCSHNNCLTMEEDGSCLCETKIVESIVFSGANDVESISKTDVMSKLFIGAMGPSNASVPIVANDITAHLVGGTLDERTVFEVKDKGRTLFLKNVQSIVKLGRGWDNPPILLEAEDASLVRAVRSARTISTLVLPKIS